MNKDGLNSFLFFCRPGPSTGTRLKKPVETAMCRTPTWQTPN